MGEKIIYINNINNMPDIEKKQWILKKTENSKFVYNLTTGDTIWFVIIKALKKEIYYGKIAIIIKNNRKNIIIFDNINKIDEDEEIYSSIENNNRLFI